MKNKNLTLRYIRQALLLMLCCMMQAVSATPVSDLEAKLRDNPQVQEKVYVHTDNSMYFVGDTLWYKAYVVRADNLQPTNMSKLLYVELLTPDGYLVERQHVLVSAAGHTCGQFVLKDSLYSGYYEIRAYTRWQLNFNVTEKDYTSDDRYKFYGAQAAKDFFRNYEGLYSRVIPIYEKPKKKGDYSYRYMARRPKQHVQKEKTLLNCHFYPEGGQLVQGVESTVAFEVTDNNGQQFDIQGKLADGRTIRPSHMGRGTFTITPGANTGSVTFEWNGKPVSFRLPKAQKQGVVISYAPSAAKAKVKAAGVTPAAYAILCRGKLVQFSAMNGAGDIAIDQTQCPTGINEIIIYDSEAQPVASRLFFVNHHDYGTPVNVSLTAGGDTIGKQSTLKPYAPVELSMTVPREERWVGTMSVAVRDAQTDDAGYDNGNIMTDMLLSSELKGFIANPAYYFASDDAQHRSDLDLLMMVQGWRRYKRVETLRYEPEKGLTYEGTVYTIPSTADILELDDVQNAGSKATTVADQMMAELDANSGLQEGNTSDDAEGEQFDPALGIDPDASNDETVEWATDDDIRLGNGYVKRSVLVEAELNKEGETAGAVTRTDRRGRFKINLPAFYDQAILFAKAYNRSDSLKKNMTANVDPDMTNERAFPDYFVRRQMFFPVFSQPYSWYQVNSPDVFFVDEDDDENILKGSRLAGNHVLQNVVVSAKRRGKRGIDMNKPAIVMDAYDVYNNASDYGLMLGVVDFKRIPMAFATYFVGNMGSRNQFNIRAMVDGASFYRNYVPMPSEYDKPHTSTDMFNKLRLSRIKNVRIYTDYDLRNDSSYVVETHSPALTMVMELVPDDARRYTYRDRRYVLDGLTYEEEFYSPDYSSAVPSKPTDYRRTLYWNPNAKIEKDGTFKAKFYNNARETRVTVSAAGMGLGMTATDGADAKPTVQLYYSVGMKK